MRTAIIFSGSWCAPCKALGLALGLTKENDHPQIKKIDIDENLELASKHGVRSVPTTIILDADENEVNRIVGFNPTTVAEIQADLAA
jgi:thioredoxin 1